jgi:hypothetical protein
MLQNITHYYGCMLAASDGAIGHVKDFYFDDRAWVVRYLVADTGSWLTGRQVLLTPHSFGRVDAAEKTFAVNLTRQQIADSPSIEQHKPVSRQYEIDYYQYYGWPAYWNGDAIWGLGGFPVVMPPSKDQIEAQQQPHHHDDKHLLSTRAVAGYTLHGSDGDIGLVSGFMVDKKSWAIRQLAVETGHWYAGREILIPTNAVEGVSYEDSKVFVRLARSALQHSAAQTVVKSGS